MAVAESAVTGVVVGRGRTVDGGTGVITVHNQIS